MPMLPWPIWPLAWQARLGQNTVVGSTAVLLILAVKWIHRSMLGSPFASQWRPTTVRCGATIHIHLLNNLHFLEYRDVILQGLNPPGFHSRIQGEKPAGAKVEIHDFLIDSGPFLHGFGRLLRILRHPLPSLDDRF